MKQRGHGAHGGAWKVAYADFVTAMMALFIVLWILGTKKETQAAVAAYFRHPAVISSGGTGFLNAEGQREYEAAVERIHAEAAAESAGAVQRAAEQLAKEGPITPEEIAERGMLARSARQLEGMLNTTELFRRLRAHVSMEFTSQGLRINVEDTHSEPLFALGSAEPTTGAFALLRGIGAVLAPLPNLILVEGHTDARPFSGEGEYGNWELSGGRANSARRALEAGGLAPERVARVVGYADRKLLFPQDPSSERNRRISIIVCYQNAPLD
jgi:chemotaxis protein MotB